MDTYNTQISWLKTEAQLSLEKESIPFSASKVISDPRGQYVIVTGILYNKLVTLASIYVPNVDDETFITSFFAALPNMDSHQLIIGGDFNLVLDPKIDRSSQKPCNIPKSAKAIHRFMNTYKLFDRFRVLSPNTKKYSYSSPVHYSHIPRTKKWRFNNSLLSDPNIV